MRIEELNNILDQTGMPVAYHHWDKPPSLPYMVYAFKDSDSFGADDKVYARFDNYNVELYSRHKDRISEAKVEDILDTHEIYYEKSEVYIKEEKLYQVLYEIQI